jgi:hypothetical protein
MTQVLLVLSVPAEFSEKSKGIMRDCVYRAELTDTLNSPRLQFTTERKIEIKTHIYMYYLFF